MSVENTPDTQPVEFTVADYFVFGDPEGAGKLRGELARHIRNHACVVAMFPHAAGYTATFLDEVFGGLIRTEKLKKADLDEHLVIRREGQGNRDYVEMAKMYISRADKAVSSGA